MSYNRLTFKKLSVFSKRQTVFFMPGFCHRERMESVAIQNMILLDCFALLAMTMELTPSTLQLILIFHGAVLVALPFTVLRGFTLVTQVFAFA